MSDDFDISYNPYYILEGHTPKRVDFREWGEWMEKNRTNRHVASTHLTTGYKIPGKKIKKVWVSTVFLGLDHNMLGGNPILFETMIFGGEYDDYQERCETWEQAETMHKIAVQLVLATDRPTHPKPKLQLIMGGINT